MAQVSGPFDAGAGAAINEGTWQKISRAYLATGVVAGRLGALAVTPGAGLTVSVATGQAQVEGIFYENDAALVLTLTAANATNPRIDTIAVRLDRTANTCVLVPIAGTAAAAPAAPTLSLTDTLFEMAVVNVTVPAAAGAIVAGNITDRRAYAQGAVSLTARQAGAGDLVGVATTSLAYVALAGGPDVSFVVPPSMSVIFASTAQLSSSAAGGGALMSFELFDVTANGVFLAPSDDHALFTNDTALQASRMHRVTFNADQIGRSFQARARYRAASSGTASFNRRSIVVMPGL